MAATGLGKTYLAAFDSLGARRVLFVAHREEILTQAMAAFRAVRPRARMGRYIGDDREPEAEILFASVQTLARSAHLSRFRWSRRRLLRRAHRSPSCGSSAARLP